MFPVYLKLFASVVVSCPALKPIHPNVFFTEIMYKPVGEVSNHYSISLFFVLNRGKFVNTTSLNQFGIDDMHEYIELYNNASKAADLAAFRFISVGGVARFTFPAGTTLAAGG